MVNKFKRFFKSLGGKHSSSSSSSSNQSTATLAAVTINNLLAVPTVPLPRNLSTAELEARLETSGSLTGTTTSNQTLVVIDDYIRGRYIDWAALLAKIPNSLRMHHMFRSSDYQSIDEAERH
ncbi:hypothetical protein GQ600_15597 [Phytophthora cactorum]|nr:hypothetical protein GQ600_15597 [Phytophthora cactorum]